MREGWNDDKLLLIQGDFFGIQNFIFASGGSTQKHAHKVLRGRSFQVGLLADCAALKLLQTLNLPPTSQIINAAGKFMLVAPNTASVRANVDQVRKELNAWCLQHTYGEIGVGIATTPASCNDFVGGRFGELTTRLFQELEAAKLHQFDLCDDDAPSVFTDFLDGFDAEYGVCSINGRHPADAKASAKRGYSLSLLADDQIRIGESLTKQTRIIVSQERDALPALGLNYFDFYIAFVPEQDVSGKYGALTQGGKILRFWDFDQPQANGDIWNGYARRFVNTYVPMFSNMDLTTSQRYGEFEDDAFEAIDAIHPIKTLHHIACENRRLDLRQDKEHWHGEIALVALKGDIDNLGAIFQKGLTQPTFTKMVSLSRQVHAFFAIWLPWYCAHGTVDGIRKFENTYTVFAGGDDFFLIGPWESTLELASQMRSHFAEYVANEGITFSVGLSMSKPQIPVRQLSFNTEEALEASKELEGKNAATLWKQTLAWKDWRELMGERRIRLETLIQSSADHGVPISNGILYALLDLSNQAKEAEKSPTAAIWRSRLHYRLARFFGDRLRGNATKHMLRDQLINDSLLEIGSAIETYKNGYRLPLSVMLYRQRT